MRTNPSVVVSTYVPETSPSRFSPKLIPVQTKVTFEPRVVQEPPFETEVHLPEHLDFEFQYPVVVTPLASATVETTPSLAPEIFYIPDGLPLPPNLIAIEEIIKDPPSNTPFHFGTSINLYPSTPEFSSFNRASS